MIIVSFGETIWYECGKYGEAGKEDESLEMEPGSEDQGELGGDQCELNPDWGGEFQFLATCKTA